MLDNSDINELLDELIAQAYVPRLVVEGGVAAVDRVCGKWVHYTLENGNKGKMILTEWKKLKRTQGTK